MKKLLLFLLSFVSLNVVSSDRLAALRGENPLVGGAFGFDLSRIQARAVGGSQAVANEDSNFKRFIVKVVGRHEHDDQLYELPLNSHDDFIKYAKRACDIDHDEEVQLFWKRNRIPKQAELQALRDGMRDGDTIFVDVIHSYDLSDSEPEDDEPASNVVQNEITVTDSDSDGRE